MLDYERETMKKWIGLGVFGVFISFFAIVIVIFSHLTRSLESDTFNIEETDEELF